MRISVASFYIKYDSMMSKKASEFLFGHRNWEKIQWILRYFNVNAVVDTSESLSKEKSDIPWKYVYSYNIMIDNSTFSIETTDDELRNIISIIDCEITGVNTCITTIDIDSLKAGKLLFRSKPMLECHSTSEYFRRSVISLIHEMENCGNEWFHLSYVREKLEETIGKTETIKSAAGNFLGSVTSSL